METFKAIIKTLVTCVIVTTTVSFFAKSVANTLEITTEKQEELVTVSFSVVYKDDDTMRKGKSTVVQEGENGEKKITYRISKQNGKIIDKEAEQEEILKEAIPKIIIRGTKIYYTCSDGTEYDTQSERDECEKKIAWEQQRDKSLSECYADSSKFNCWYDAYPGTTLHWSYYTKSSNGRTGAICKDGWISSATGRGACSHHGGVRTWLYQPLSRTKT